MSSAFIFCCFNLQLKINTQKKILCCVPGKKIKNGVLNGWVAFYSRALEQRVPLPEEAPNECRQRVMKECKDAWNLLGQQEKEEYSNRAKMHNKRQKSLQLVSAARETQLAETRGEDMLVIARNELDTGPNWPDLLSEEGFGAMGCGDEEFALNTQDVKDADERICGFVSNLSSKWRNESGRISGTHMELVAAEHARAYRLSCLEQYLDKSVDMSS